MATSWFVFLIFPLVLSYNFDEEYTKILIKACEDANKEINCNGALHRPQVRQVEENRGREISTKDPVCFQYRFPYILWDPLNQFPSLFKEVSKKLLCPLCSRNGKKEFIIDTMSWKNGKTSRLPPRLILDVKSPVVLIPKLYSCFGGHREIVSCDPDILKQLPEVFVEFFTSHKSGVSKDFLQLCEQLLDKGLSLSSIEEMTKQRYENNYNEMKRKYLTNISLAKQNEETLEIPAEFVPFEQLDWPFPSANLLTNAILSKFEREETKYKRLFSSLSAEWIACDHTYKSIANVGYYRSTDGKWIKKYKGFFIITNEKGQPIQWKFTKTEQFDEVKNTFKQLSERFKAQGKAISGIYTDTCCKWAAKFEDVFDGVPVKLDVFHAVQRLSSTIPKRTKFRAEIIRAYSLVFRDPKDLGEQRLLNTPRPHILINNLRKFEAEWKARKDNSGHCLLNGDAIKEIKNIETHMVKGCLSDIPPGCGTNRNERLNKHVNEFLSTNKIGVPLAHARCFKLFAQLKSMKGKTAEYFALCGKLNETSTERIETFAFEGDPEPNSTGTHKKWNINYVEGETIESVAKYIQSLLDDENDKIQSNNCHSYILNQSATIQKTLHILHDSICLWRTQNYLQRKFGKKIATFKSVLHDSRSVSIDLDADGNESNDLDRIEVDTTQVHTIANSNGFEVIQIEGDGNCFFSAVALQIQRLVQENKISRFLRNHLQNLGILQEGAFPGDLADILRTLIVEEWTGPFMEDYQQFFQDINVQQEASEFLRSGHFSSSLGDSMPLAMANLLQIPIFILTPHYLTPFISVFPRQHADCVQPLMLAYDNTGPGHYDALQVKANQSEQSDTLFECGENAANTNNPRPDLICRCGINVKNSSKRSYKSRCKCIALNAECSSKCKCRGKCGGVDCKKNKVTDDQSFKKTKKSWKRGQHPIKSPTKSPRKTATSENGPLNVLEYLVIFAIVNYALSMGLSYSCEQISQIYNEIVELIVEHEQLMSLPICNHSQRDLDNTIRSVKKRYQSDH